MPEEKRYFGYERGEWVVIVVRLVWPADRIRTASVAMADCGISWNTHDPGVVLTHLAVAIADGGDCLSDFEALRSQSELFGDVASISTA